MKSPDGPKTWETTRVQGLLRNKQSGRYYARIHSGSKEIWKALKTTHFSIAEARLATTVQEHRARTSVAVDPSNARMTFEGAASLHMKRVREDVSLKRRTKTYWQETLDALLKSWPELAHTEIKRLTQTALREWAARYAKTASASRYNHMISLIRQVIAIAIENGVIYANPAIGLKRKPERPKQLQLPTRIQFAAFIPEIRAGRSRDSRNCADLAQGLAFTGCRKTEASFVAWKDLDFTNGEVTIHGDPEEGTKNGTVRRIPMIPEARELFERMRQERADEPNTAKVFLVHECQKAMDRAAKKVGMARITHHDLRHFFATVCIESGVDIPTVSRWLGHSDGGALAMSTYGHLRREHSVAQAQKVSFGCLAA